MAPDENPPAHLDPVYIKVASVYSRLGRAFYQLLRHDLEHLKHHLAQVEETTKKAWAAIQNHPLPADKRAA